MSRYLTPSKLCNLVLVTLYCDNVVPNKSTIPILTFIISQLYPEGWSPTPTPSAARRKSKRQRASLSTASARFETLTPSSSSSLAPSIEDFERATACHQSAVIGRTLHDALLKRLWAIDSLHEMHAFFASLREFVGNFQDLSLPEDQRRERFGDRIILARASPLGIFLRRACLEHTRLQFGDAVTLWMDFVNFRAPSEETFRKRNPSAEALICTLDANLAEMGLDADDQLSRAAYAGLVDSEGREALRTAGVTNAEDLERLLELHLERLQRYGERMPDDMRKRLHSLLLPAQGPDSKGAGLNASGIPSLIHFVRFFDAWRGGDYVTAFDSLHRYFDYSPHLASKTQYQYALLHVAILQADFGKFSEAYSTMKECIATARENQDVSCLNFALSWLEYLNTTWPADMKAALKEDGSINGSYLLSKDKQNRHFLRLKATEMKAWPLLASTLLSEAKAILSEVLCAFGVDRNQVLT